MLLAVMSSCRAERRVRDATKVRDIQCLHQRGCGPIEAGVPTKEANTGTLGLHLGQLFEQDGLVATAVITAHTHD